MGWDTIAFTPDPMPDVDTGAFASAGSEAIIAGAIRSWMDAADACQTWQEIAGQLARLLDTIVRTGDAAARTTRVQAGAETVTVGAREFHAYRSATLAAGLMMARMGELSTDPTPAPAPCVGA